MYAGHIRKNITYSPPPSNTSETSFPKLSTPILIPLRHLNPAELEASLRGQAGRSSPSSK